MRCVMLHVKLSSRSHAECGAVLPATPVSCVSIELRCVCVCVFHSRSTLSCWPNQHPALLQRLSFPTPNTGGSYNLGVPTDACFTPTLLLLSAKYIYSINQEDRFSVQGRPVTFATSPDIGARLFWCATNCLPYLKQNCPCPHHEGLQ